MDNATRTALLAFWKAVPEARPQDEDGIDLLQFTKAWEIYAWNKQEKCMDWFHIESELASALACDGLIAYILRHSFPIRSFGKRFANGTEQWEAEIPLEWPGRIFRGSSRLAAHLAAANAVREREARP